MNDLLEYWLLAPWYIALLIATVVHLNIYFWGGLIGQILTTIIWPKMGIGCIIDQYPAKPGQVRGEVKYGVVACLIFGVTSLSYRHLTVGLPGQLRQFNFLFSSFTIISTDIFLTVYCIRNISENFMRYIMNRFA